VAASAAAVAASAAVDSLTRVIEEESMKMNWVKKSILVACLGAVSVMSFAQESALQTKVDLYLKDADLLTATRLLSQQTGLQFVLVPGENQFAKINLSLDDVSAEKAIMYLCQAAGGYAERSEDGVYVIKFGSKRDPQATSNVVAPDKVIFREIKIQQADPRAVLELLVDGRVSDPDRDYREMNDLKQLSMPQVMSTSSIFGTPSEFINQNRLDASTRDFVGNKDVPPTGLTLPGGDANQRGSGGGGGGQIGGGGQPGGGGGQIGGGGQNGGQNGGASISGTNAGGQGMLPAGTQDLIYNPATNELIFRGTSQAYQELLDILSRIDKAPKQVTVKVEFVTTTRNIDKSFGIDWNYERGGVFAGVAPGRFASSADPVFLNYATGNVSMRLRTLLSDNNGRVVTAPVVRTMNNQSASVSAGTTTFVFVTNNIVTAGGTTNTTTTPIPINLTSNLAVRPRINGDNTITMTLNPNITNITGFRTSPDGQSFPETSFQTLSVAIRVKDGETVALGGLTAKQDSFTQQRIPLLSDLPVIGQLFRKKTTTQSSTELIVFVTPKIVDEGTPGLGIP
jgi:general secretion pathway protein D